LAVNRFPKAANMTMLDESSQERNYSVAPAIAPELRSFYIDLYKLVVDEVHKYHTLHHQRVLYFSGLVTTILGGVFLGLVKSTIWYHYAFVAVGLLLLVQVCEVGRVGIAGAYRLLLEAITMRAKLEQALLLTEPGWSATRSTDSAYWQAEPLIPSRHLEDRRQFSDSSAAWQAHFLAEGNQRWPVRFLMYSQILGLLLLLTSCVLTLKELLGL
jgi:hypothetical protein